MLDIKTVRQDPQGIASALAARSFHFDVAQFTALDARRKQADIDSQNLLAERKSASKKIGTLVSQGVSVDEAKAQVDATLQKIAAELDALTEQAKQAQAEIEGLLLATPNVPAQDVPHGSSEADNLEVARWGEPRRFDFPIKDHVALGEGLHLLDSETAGKITGSRFTVMYRDLARLHRALIQFMLNLHTGEHGYAEVYVPYIVNRDSLLGTGQLPKFEEDLFKLHADHDLYLIPTAEVPVTNIARDRIFEDVELGADGIRFACHTPCFRSEAGSYGRDTRGLIRQHQFEHSRLWSVTRRPSCNVWNCLIARSSCAAVISVSLRRKPMIWKCGCQPRTPTAKYPPVAISVITRRAGCRPAGAIRIPASRSCCTP
jgi:seryl-tRNA synthetase